MVLKEVTITNTERLRIANIIVIMFYRLKKKQLPNAIF